MARSLVCALLVALALVAPAKICAQTPEDCRTEARAPLFVFPASGAPNASIDAPVVVRYGAGYFDPITGPGDPPSTLFQLVSCGFCGSPCDLTTGTPVPGLVQTQGDDLIFLPDGGFATSTQYAGEAMGIDGVLDFSFCTGTQGDSSPPTGVALTDDPSSTQVGPLTCLPDGGYRVGVYFPPATDDGPPGSIEYLLFETRGAGIDAPVLVDRYRNFQTDRITMSFLLSHEAASELVCLQVVTVDGAGHATVPDGDRCFDPTGRTTFQGCAASPSHRGSGVLGLGLGITMLWLARRRRAA